MKNQYLFLILVILFFFLSSCAETNQISEEPQQILPTPTRQAPQQETLPKLFRNTTEPASNIPNDPHIARSRLVHINAVLLLDAKNQILDLDPETQLIINLFPDVNYVGVIESIEKTGQESYSWVGYLKDVEYSSMYIIFTDGVFLTHFASPAGVYEVHLIENDLYQVVEIDQSELPQD